MFTQLTQSYIQSLKEAGKAESTITAYGKDVEQFSEFLLKRHKNDPKQVEPEDFEDYRQELTTLRYSSKSVARKINSLKSFFRFLHKQGVIAVNPVKKILQLRFSQTSPRFLKPVEFRALRDVVKRDPRIRAVVELLLQTGMRISELAALRVEDISLPKKQVFIAAQGSQESRVVPLNAPALDSILEYIKIRPRTKERTFFLTKSCRPFLIRNIRTSIDRYFKLAGIEDAKVNDLRHTFIVEQLSAGVPLLSVCKIVGHKRLSTTERYLEYVDNSRLESELEVREL